MKPLKSIVIRLTDHLVTPIQFCPTTQIPKQITWLPTSWRIYCGTHYNPSPLTFISFPILLAYQSLSHSTPFLNSPFLRALSYFKIPILLKSFIFSIFFHGYFVVLPFLQNLHISIFISKFNI